MEKIISLSELAVLLNKSRITIWRYWAKDCYLPKPILINGRCLGWERAVIKKWLEDQQGN